MSGKGRLPASSAWVALLRGINVGGKNRLAMKDLTEMVIATGATEVRTYIQSGNVAFRAAPELARRMPSELTAAIAARCDLRVPVTVRGAAELRRIVDDNPYLQEGADPSSLAVAFLAAKPSAAQVAGLAPDRSPPDRFTVRGSEIYLDFPNGLARSKLTNAWFDSALGTVCTVRNWRTALQLLAMVEQ